MTNLEHFSTFETMLIENVDLDEFLLIKIQPLCCRDFREGTVKFFIIFKLCLHHVKVIVINESVKPF